MVSCDKHNKKRAARNEVEGFLIGGFCRSNTKTVKSQISLLIRKVNLKTVEIDEKNYGLTANDLFNPD